MTALLCVLSFAGGVALCWFAKDKITMLVTGTQSFIAKLEAKAAALKAIVK